jgi:tRNA(His) 5'-end guanylyltransferase
MAEAMLYAADNIEDCVFAFSQSDEITLVLRNDQSLESQPWFNNRLQKIGSVCASLITAAFNRRFYAYQLAMFDARVFVVPNIEEAINTVQYRQQDCIKNSISCACYAELGKVLGKKEVQKLLNGANSKQRQELLFQKVGINWNDYEPRYKNGIACYRVAFEVKGARRTKWVSDFNLPTFSADRAWVRNKLDFMRVKDETVIKGCGESADGDNETST